MNTTGSKRHEAFQAVGFAFLEIRHFCVINKYVVQNTDKPCDVPNKRQEEGLMGVTVTSSSESGFVSKKELHRYR